MLTGWLEALWSLLYPRRCPACRQLAAAGSFWCETCRQQVLRPHIVQPQPRVFHELDSCWAAAEYTGFVRRLIRDMKFRRLERPAKAMGELVDIAAPFADERWGPACIDAVVPVPLHRERYRERGFNQTEKIFSGWRQSRGLPWREALERIRSTRPQWELGLEARRQNITGAFAVTRPEEVRGKRFLLVDDICTSGITLEECARTLKAAGALKVTGLVLASAQRVNEGPDDFRVQRRSGQD